MLREQWARPSREPWFRLIGYTALLCLSACATAPNEFGQRASALGLVPGWVNSDGFRLATFRNSVREPRALLHLYLDGDGRPWLSRTQVARNPTPYNPLVLELLARDSSPALYLGRPCYHGEHQASGCSAWLWTSGRYSETVISAMANAVAQLLAAESINRVTLIGYSGGGVIAWHLAQRIPQVERLVTVAANLDLGAWVQRHRYSPLVGSLDPAHGPPMREDVEQLHLIGKRDDNVPASLTERMQERFGTSFRRQLSDAGHSRGWLEHWPSHLANSR